MIITLYAGVLIDRVGGKRVLILERILLIFLAVITGLILLFDQVEIWHIIVLSTITGSTIALSLPTTQSLVPQVVSEEDRQAANSMNQLGYATGRTLGPLEAGILDCRTERSTRALRVDCRLQRGIDCNIRHFCKAPEKTL